MTFEILVTLYVSYTRINNHTVKKSRKIKEKVMFKKIYVTNTTTYTYPTEVLAETSFEKYPKTAEALRLTLKVYTNLLLSRIELLESE